MKTNDHLMKVNVQYMKIRGHRSLPKRISICLGKKVNFRLFHSSLSSKIHVRQRVSELIRKDRHKIMGQHLKDGGTVAPH